MAASTMSPRAKMVFRRHVPPAQVSELKNSAVDLMTRSAFIAQVPAEPKQSTTHRNARRIGKSVRPLRSTVRPKTVTTPTSGPGHKLDADRAPRQAVTGHGNSYLHGATEDTAGYPAGRGTTGPGASGSRVVEPYDFAAIPNSPAWVEERPIETRMKDPDGGRMIRVGDQKAVIATFTHETSRNLDPPLHILLLAACYSPRRRATAAT